MASKSTATSDYYRNADGSYTRRLAQDPINYRDAAGNWQPIDTGVQRGSDGRWHEKANSMGVDFAPSATDSALVRVDNGNGHVFSYRLQGAASAASQVSGSSVTYPHVQPGTDLVLRPTAVGMKESIVLHTARAANSWTFPLDLKGLTPVLAKDGSIELRDASDKRVGEIPPAYAYDSKVDPKSGERATTHAVSYKLTRQQGRTALVVTLDPAWLHAAGRVFPVTVDPSYDNAQATTTYAESQNPGDHSMEAVIKIGSYDSGTHDAVSYLSFPALGLDDSKVSVSAATLNLYDVWASTCTAERFDVAPVTKAWTPSQVTSYPGPSYGSSIGNATPTVSNACGNTGGNLATGNWVAVNLSTSQFNTWASASGATNDYGLAVYASTTDNLHWKQFGSIYDDGYQPYLALTYTGAMLPEIVSSSPPNNAPVQTLTPQLSATGQIDPNLAVNPKYDFQVYDTSGNKIVDSGTITANYYNVPAGKLTWGKTYYWFVECTDGTNWSSGPNWQAMTTQVPQPVVTSGLSQNTDGHGYSPAIGNYTTSATDANVATPGPSLSVVRDYNSRDPRTAGAFGAGWSTVFDARATEQYDSSGAVSSVQVTYPDGSVIGYGKNSDGSFSPPQGRFATFKSVTGGGYTLTDKNATVYTFTQSLGSGAYGITSITDANGRAENFTWSSGEITTVTSVASGRVLHLTWSTPSGAKSAHVATVSTDPVTAGNSSTALTWTYSYSGDQLTKVCSPVDTTGCTQYGYASGSQYYNETLDEGPHSFWPLTESSGTTANSAVLAQEGNDDGTYNNVTLGQSGPLAGSTATAAGFNGSSSYVALPNLNLGNSSSQSVSLWFKTSTASAGVLFSYSDMPIEPSATQGNFTPALYVGSDGKLNGLFWYGSTTTPITTSASVADGKWHHVVLAGSWTAQTMWLDGKQAGTAGGYGSFGFTGNMPWLFTHPYLGTGYLGSTWPDEPHQNSSTIYATYFNGSIGDAAYFGRPLVQADVSMLYKAGTTAAGLMSSVTRPSGKAYASVGYDAVTGAVTNLTDDNGGSWSMAAPTVSGSSQVYRGAVLGAGPTTYYRLGESAGASQAVDEVNSGPATYSNVTLGASGPFSDKTAARFNGTSSYLQLPSAADTVTTGPNSVEMWFNMPSGNTAGGVLFDQEQCAISNNPVGCGGYDPALYVGTDGKLHAKFWDSNGTSSQMVTSTSVNDGKWHHVILAASTNAQVLYLDGNKAGSTSGTLSATGQGYTYIGAGAAGGNWANHPTNTLGYFPGSIAEVAFYRTQLTGQDAATHYAAGQQSGGLTPLETVKVTDPGSKTDTYQYDLWNGDRLVDQIDGLGNKTSYGYDTGGFQHTVTNPDGDATTTGHDVRGNTVSTTTCQNQAGQKCSTSYMTYLPDDTSTQLSPNAQNDLVATSRDGRSASATDNTYLTSYSYDSSGNRTGVTTPAVAGFPNGRTTTISYTDGTTIAAADSGYAPKGLPYKTVSPGGATTTIGYFKDGDIASITDPDGQVTKFTYDNIGRILTKTVTSDSYPNGLTTSYAYDGVSQVTSETDPSVTDRVTGAVHQARTTTVYDADGNVTSQTVADLSGGDASRTVSSTYNTHDQVATGTDAAGGVTTYTYDGYGNQATVQDPNGNTLAYAYDANGHLLSQTLKSYTGDPVNPQAAQDLVESSRTYDPAGRLQSITDSMGNTTSYTYTDNGLTATITKSDPTGKQTYVQQSDTYDAAGNLTQQVTNNGATTTTSVYDAADRATSTSVDPTGVDRTTTVSYTPDDKVATSTLSDATGATHTTSFTYDPMGHLTSSSVQEDGSGHPVVWWPLTQTSGTTVTDKSGTGNTGNLSATGVSWSSGAASFSGAAGESISTNGPAFNTASSYSVTAWVNLASAGTGSDQTVAAAFGASATAFSLGYKAATQAWTVNLAATDTAGTTGSSITAASNSATAGTWTQLTYVFNASTATGTLYVNGSQAATGSDSSPWNASRSFVVGDGKYNGTTTNPLNGQVDNVQAYARALSASEVSTLYSAGRTGGTTASTSQATTSWQLDQRGLPTSMTDPDSNVTNYTYDEAGRLAVTSAPAVNVETGGGTPSLAHPTTTVGYDTFGEQTETQDPDGNTVVTAYDADGRKAARTLPSYTPPGSTTPISNATTNWTYDKGGNVTKVTDPLSNATSYLYDQLGDVAKVTDADNGVTHTVYDTNGQALSVTDPTGAQTQATYDFLGRPLTSTVLERYPSTASYTTTNSYTASSSNPGGAFLASTTSPDGVSTSYGYDNIGEQLQVTDGAGNTTQYAYDLQGRRTAVTLPDGTRNTVGYDQLGDPTQVQALDTDHTTVLSTRSATYDAAGRLMSATDPSNHTTTYTRDALGKVTAEVQPVSATHSITTSFGYDAAGNGTRYTDGRGNPTIYSYNSWNLPESTVEPSVTTSTYSYTTAADSTFTTAYDADGRPVTQTQPGGVSVTTAYDNLGNVTSQSGTGADAATATRSFTYDADNRMLTAATAAIGTTTAATNETFTYNDRGQLLTAGGSAGSSSFAYNGDSLPTSRTDAAGTTSYGYDTADRLATLTDPATGTQLSYGYNSLSLPTTVTYGSGGDVRTYGYDHLHRLTSDTLTAPGGATIASIAYGYDSNGNETSKTTTGLAGASSNTYGYDWANRLTSWNNGTTTTAYGYDDSGNRIQVGSNVYTYDARDQLTSDGTHTYTYSARGTLTQQTSTSGTVNVTSDAFGQQATQGTQTYLTDALGRVITDTSTNGPNTTFSYTGAGNSLASDGTNTYTWTPGGSLIGIGTVGGTTSTATLAFADQHTDVVGNFSANGTAMTASTAYDPLGNVTASGNTAMAGKLGYQSGWTDNATGKVNMAARWYNPATGQFMNKDTASLSPIPNSAAANPFAYVDDNPLTRTDPTGHGWWSDITGAASDAWNTASSWASDAWDTASSWASDAWDTVSNWASDAWHTATRWASDAWDSAVSAFDDVISSLDREIAQLDREISQLSAQVYDGYRAVSRRVSRGWHAATRFAGNAYRGTVNVVTTAYHAAARAVRTTATYFKNHAAAIASFAASTAVFAGCEAVLGVSTGGVGAVVGAAGCGALAGAVGGAVDQGTKCMDGQSGACSVGAFAESTVLGAVGGAVGGALGGSLGGKLAESALGEALPSLVTNTLEGAAFGGVSGAVTGAAAYGMNCPDSGTGCSWSGAADATLSGAADGAIGGAFGGAVGTGVAAAKARVSGGGGEPASSEVPEEEAGGACPTPTSEDSEPHSFTGSTSVVMADGSAKPIDRIKVGDKIKNSVPGQPGTQTHTVDKVIVTHTDHDFVDVTIAQARDTAKPTPTSLRSRLLGKARLGLAGLAAATTVLVGGQPAMAAGHHHEGAHAAATDIAVHGSTLTTTFHHPFYDETQSSFVAADHLRIGDLLQTPTGIAEVTGLRLYHADTTTYDLTIDGLHTYYVEAGDIPVLVHNCNTTITARQVSLIREGPHANESVPATGAEVTSTQSEAMQGLPCHSCGEAPEDVTMVGDHQPPTGLAPEASQNLFPQCPECSGDQSKAVVRAQKLMRDHFNMPDPKVPGYYEKLLSILDSHTSG
ncbi:LamG-like jellyroll fold domain-containing protein [Streptomyces sp. NPDC001848]|uniref:LamG-like jellyroll fold domain-containing protein n=1 Tax=Streptomyces sp. NPDC001848 TaxID=3364618 RepID=UPI00367AA850